MDTIVDFVRVLSDAIAETGMKFDIHTEDCGISCLKKLCSNINISKMIIAQSTRNRNDHNIVPTANKIVKDCIVNEDEMEFELAGQPLECDFFALDSDHDEKAFVNYENLFPIKCINIPVKMENARKLLDTFNLIVMEKEPFLTQGTPLIVLCDGTDPLKTFLLGSLYRNKTVTTISASVLGFLTPTAFPSLVSIRNKHLQLFDAGSSVMIESEAFCQYSILDNKQPNSSDASSSLIVDCHWKKVISLLESPAANAVCKLLIKVVPGEEISPAYAIYKELSLLKCLLHGLKTGEIVWGVEPSDICPFDKVKSLISGIKDGSHWRKPHSQKISEFIDTSDFDMFLEAIVMGKRQQLEFTDHLWTALSCCSSYSELKENIEFIVSAIKDRDIKPVILQSNKTTLGRWIKAINEDESRAADISLEGTVPLKLLLELGIAKLKNDYSTIFIGLELTTEELLQPFLVHNSNFERAVDLLCNLHCALELIVMCKTYLQLSREILGTYARQAIKFYSSVDSAIHLHQFQFPIQLLAVRKAISNLQPVEWELSFRTCTENYTGHTSCHLSLEPPFPYLNQNNSVVGENSNELRYFCTTVTCVEDSSLF